MLASSVTVVSDRIAMEVSASTTSSAIEKENTPVKAKPPTTKSPRTHSEILDEDIAQLEAENAEMEAKLQLDKRVSFTTAPEPVLDATTPSRSVEVEAPTPRTIEAPTPSEEVVEQQAFGQQVADVFWMTPVLEWFAQLTGGGFCVPSKETLAKEEASTIAASPAITA